MVVQSFTPQAESIQFARQADFVGFAGAELEVRREFGYPPQRHLIRHLFRGANPDKPAQVRLRAGPSGAAGALGSRVELRGPAPAPIEKIRDEYSLANLVLRRQCHPGDRRPGPPARRVCLAGGRDADA